MRRDPQTIVAAHKMDPSRRDLYVEGLRDKAFVEWVADDGIHADAQVIISDFVDVPGIEEGGNRARVISFLQAVEGQATGIRGLVDADHARLDAEPPRLPSNLWLTDYRDLEAYVLSPTHVDSALRAGCGIPGDHGERLYSSAASIARFMAAIRLVSARDGLKLPVSAGKWLRGVSCSRQGELAADRPTILRRLMQAADVSLERFESISDAVVAQEADLLEIDDRHVVNGKDFGFLFTKQLKSMGATDGSASPILFATFARHRLADHAVLEEVITFLVRNSGSDAAGGAAA